jgi:uncharacterized membrane protein
MVTEWTYAAPPMVAAFFASAVEFIEAMTVVLAVSATRGWRGAAAGTGLAIAILLVMVAVLGPALTTVPLATMQMVIGGLLLLFGLRWLRKAILRYAGVIPMRDEDAAYAREEATLRLLGRATRRWDPVAVAASFKITMLEGIEVVFVVIAIGAGGTGLLIPASAGALLALILVIVVGALLHRPISSIPENALKFAVGTLLSAFGCFWIGESVGYGWPGGDWSITGLIAAFFAISALTVHPCRLCSRTGTAATNN